MASKHHITQFEGLLMCSLCRGSAHWLINLNTRPDIERDIEEFLNIKRYLSDQVTRHACTYCIDKIQYALLRKKQFLNSEYAIAQFLREGSGMTQIDLTTNNLQRQRDQECPPLYFSNSVFNSNHSAPANSWHTPQHVTQGSGNRPIALSHPLFNSIPKTPNPSTSMTQASENRPVILSHPLFNSIEKTPNPSTSNHISGSEIPQMSVNTQNRKETNNSNIRQSSPNSEESSPMELIIDTPDLDDMQDMHNTNYFGNNQRETTEHMILPPFESLNCHPYTKKTKRRPKSRKSTKQPTYTNL